MKKTELIIDSNLLLVYLVGLYDPKLLSRHRRTQDYTPDDFTLLTEIITRLGRVEYITTPNILTEVSNLASKVGEKDRQSLFEFMSQRLLLFREETVPSRDVLTDGRFAELGLTDLVIERISRTKSRRLRRVVLTVDFNLVRHVEKTGTRVINFNHVRYHDWQ